MGHGALQQNTTASSNTAVGYQSGYSNTTAPNNTFVGFQAGYTGTTATNNTFVGLQTGYFITTGARNTFVGVPTASGASGWLVTTGSANTVLGGYSGNQGGLDIRTASNNIVLSDGDGNPRGYWNSGGNFFTVQSAYLRGSTGQTSGGAINYTGNWVDGGTNTSIFEARLTRFNTSDYRWVLGGSGVNGEVLRLAANAAWQGADTFQDAFLFGAFSGGFFSTQQDNFLTLGQSTNRWTVVYATTGTINTSDRNQKQDIQDLSAAELAVATEIKTLFKSFRWKDAVASKGDSARIHIGVIAQDVQEAFAKQGLDAARYALWCEDVHYEVDGKHEDSIGVKYTAETEGAVPVTKLGIRYDQLLAFVIAAM
jgi:ribosomal protein L9